MRVPIPSSLLPPEVELAPPGAGLPKLEQWIATRMIRWNAKRTSREQAAKFFATERATIIKIMRGVGEQSWQKRVLIKRLRGLEDSSRFWSLLMVVDHLRIVNQQITGVIAHLSKGSRPPQAADTAKVKPSEDAGFEVIAAFEQACENFIETVSNVENLKTDLTFDHPWFGAMDAATWHFMTAFHMRLHRKQMEQIISTGLETKTSQCAGSSGACDVM